MPVITVGVDIPTGYRFIRQLAGGSILCATPAGELAVIARPDQRAMALPEKPKVGRPPDPKMVEAKGYALALFEAAHLDKDAAAGLAARRFSVNEGTVRHYLKGKTRSV